MPHFSPTRPTIYQAEFRGDFADYKAQVPDAGRRRLLAFGADFDTRAVTLEMAVEDHWQPEIRKLWLRNKEAVQRQLAHQYGERDTERKIADFIALGTKPMSVVAYHNEFFEQIRGAFTMGQYYPALVGACALGERILNHLVIDLRGFFKASPEYKRVWRKDSFDNWDLPIDALEAWDVLLPEATAEFRSLKALRNRSLHFNTETYRTLREDALAAIASMQRIIDLQFGTFGPRPWFIEGTVGHMFVRKEFEKTPLIATYFAPNCAFVGPNFGMRPVEGVWGVMDVPDYGDGDLSDEEFKDAYNDRDPASVVTEPPTFDASDGVDDAERHDRP